MQIRHFNFGDCNIDIVPGCADGCLRVMKGAGWADSSLQPVRILVQVVFIVCESASSCEHACECVYMQSLVRDA